jgi:hypothetical protein
MPYTERYCRADAAGSGNGTTDTNSGANGAWTLAEAIANATAGMRVNIKSGTYSLGASITLPNGATENPIVWQGFQSALGDLEDVGRATPTASLTTTNFPLINGGTSWRVTCGTFNALKNLRIATRANTETVVGSASSNFWRCVFENTNANGSAAAALSIGNNYTAAVDCDMSIATSGGSASAVTAGRGSIIGCRIWNSSTIVSTQQGISATELHQAISGNLIFNIGIAITTGSFSSNVIFNSWHNVVTGIFVNGGFNGVIANNVGWQHSGFAVRGTASSGNFLIYNNAFGSHTSGRLDGATLGTVIDEMSPILLTENPFTNSGGGDYTLNNSAGGGALCRNASRLFGGFGDLGSVQAQAAASSSGLLSQGFVF